MKTSLDDILVAVTIMAVSLAPVAESIRPGSITSAVSMSWVWCIGVVLIAVGLRLPRS